LNFKCVIKASENMFINEIITKIISFCF